MIQGKRKYDNEIVQMIGKFSVKGIIVQNGCLRKKSFKM